MPEFGPTSKANLATCDERLQRLFNVVVMYYDCSVICGFRGEIDQNRAFLEGKSKKMWPHGEHNKQPSRAVDVLPFPIDWNDTNRMRFFAGYVLGVAKMLGLSVRWGGDWDSDRDLKDQTFNDLPHFELAD